MDAGGSTKARLLAIDDSADSADLIARIASGCGYDAQATSDPDAVRRLVSEWKPEVLTLDLCMPDADGVNLLAILADSGFDGRLVIISGQEQWFRLAVGKLATFRGLKVAGELEKPVGIAALRQLLRRLREENWPRPECTRILQQGGYNRDRPNRAQSAFSTEYSDAAVVEPKFAR